MTDTDLDLPQSKLEHESLGHVFKLLKPLTPNVDLVEFEINLAMTKRQAYQAFLLKRQGAYQGVIIDLGQSNLLFLLTAKARQHINLAGFLSRLVLPFLLQTRPKQHLRFKHFEQAEQLLHGLQALGLDCQLETDEAEWRLLIPAQAALAGQLQSQSDEVYQQAITDLALQQAHLQQLYMQLHKSLSDCPVGTSLEKAADEFLLAYLDELFKTQSDFNWVRLAVVFPISAHSIAGVAAMVDADLVQLFDLDLTR